MKSHMDFSKNPILIVLLKSKMAEIRQLENRHDVIFFSRGWSDLDKISQAGAEWYVDCSDMVESKPDVKFQYGDVWANSMACHPRATCHIAGCCHLANSMSWSQSYVSHCKVLPPGEFNGMSSQSHVSHWRMLPLDKFTVMIPEPHATLQGVKIPSAILKIVIRHILFMVCFLMQFGLWRAAVFVSSPIHLFILK